MEQTGYAYAEMGFQEVMEAGRNRARDRLERLAYMGPRVIEKRPPRRVLLSVADVCAMTGLSVQRVKALCGQGRFRGARRKRGEGSGKGTAWRIPADLLEGSTGIYRPTLYRARKGPALDHRVEKACNVELERDAPAPF
jgi:hypothetical protein